MRGRKGRHFRSELEPSAVHSADHHLPHTVVAYGLAGGSNATGNAGIRDRPTLPDRRDDLVLRHHAVAVLDKMNEEGKNLRLKLHRSAAAAELEPLRIELKLSEGPRHTSDYSIIAVFCTTSSGFRQARPQRKS